MDGWEIHPEELQSTLESTQTAAKDVAGKLSEDVFSGLADNLQPMDAGGAPLNGVTGQVPQAVSNLLNDQQQDLKSIFTTIEAAIWGAVGAGQEILAGNSTMASQAVTAARDAGLDGDLSHFTAYGWKAPDAPGGNGSDTKGE